MTTCMICGKGPLDGTSLYRQNPKGEAGIWACMAHSQQPAAPEVNKLVAVVERDQLRKCGHALGSSRWCPDCEMDQPTNEREQLAMRRVHAAHLH